MQAIAYQDYQTPNAEIVVALALNQERRRNRSLRKMLIAQAIYIVIVTAASLAVAMRH